MELGLSSERLGKSEHNWGSEFPHFCAAKTTTTAYSKVAFSEANFRSINSWCGM